MPSPAKNRAGSSVLSSLVQPERLSQKLLVPAQFAQLVDHAGVLEVLRCPARIATNAFDVFQRQLLAEPAGHSLAGTPVALAGYRFEENLIHGKFVYVDDLVTAADERRGGLGARLLDAVAMIGRDAGRGRLVLDTALDNVLAHRFYYRQGMLARALRFSRPLEPR